MSGTARLLMDLYERLGCEPVWTCAPYQLPGRPRLGDHIVGSESNAVTFYNSVVGARTNKYGDYLDVCAALVGRVPYSGLHTDAGRRPLRRRRAGCGHRRCGHRAPALGHRLEVDRDGRIRITRAD